MFHDTQHHPYQTQWVQLTVKVPGLELLLEVEMERFNAYIRFAWLPAH